MSVCQLNREEWADPWWRLNNLYTAVMDNGKAFAFRPNDAQKYLYDNMWYLNLILKARQLGFTTFIDLLLLDQALFTPQQTCGIIAQTDLDVQNIFRTKVKFPYDHLPLGLRNARETETDSTRELAFNNGSTLRVGTSMRSGTLQYLHISEFGKISRKYPEKAAEIRTGSLNTLAVGQFCFIESTAEGKGGDFYEMVKTAAALDQQVKAGTAKLTPLDFRLHFYAWWQKPSNRLAEWQDVVIPEKMAEYFAEIEAECDMTLDPEQKAWYVKKEQQQRDGMKAEHPSTPKEPFEVAVEGVVYGRDMVEARKDGRITKVPYVRSIPVDTWWDFGLNSKSGKTAIICGQHVAMQDRFLRAYENAGPSLDHYVEWLMRQGFVFGTHYLPHDAAHKRLGMRDTRSWRQMLEELMPGHKFVVVPRISDINVGIKMTQAKFDGCAFDEIGCAPLIEALENYHREYSEQFQAYGAPVHDKYSDLADAFRGFGQARPAPTSSIPLLTPFKPHDPTVAY